MTTLDFKLGDLTISSKGARAIPVSTKSGQPLIWMHNEALTVCYQPSAYNDPDATRVNLFGHDTILSRTAEILGCFADHCHRCRFEEVLRTDFVSR